MSKYICKSGCGCPYPNGYGAHEFECVWEEKPLPKPEAPQEFPKGKESYCPRCYFESDKTILRAECPHNQAPQEWEKEFEERWVSKQAHISANPAQGVYCGDKDEILSFIRRVAQQEYERGQSDAFEGRIQNLKTLTITEKVNVPKELRELLVKEAIAAERLRIEGEIERKVIDKCFVGYDEDPDVQCSMRINTLLAELLERVRGKDAK